MPYAAPVPLHIDPEANLPIFAQLRQQITWLIASGNLRPGDRLPPIRALADQLGIHMHTVRQTYHVLEADGLVETGPGRGTRILPFDLTKLVAQSPDLSTNTIGVLVPSLNPFYTPFLHGLETTARQFSYLLLVCYTHDNEELTRHYARQLIAKNVDGLIAASPVADVLDGNDPDRIGWPPIVHVDAPQYSDRSILLDLEGAGFKATTHLAEHGHPRIGLITAPLKWPNFHESFKGYQRALSASNLGFEPAIVIEAPAFERDCGFQAASRLLKLEQPPTAIFVSGDLLAVGAIQAIKDSGLGVPEDIAIVSKDNIDLAALIDPPITTVSSPSFQLGVEAINMLNRLRSGQAVGHERVVLDTELIIRRSCGCSP